MSMMNSFYRIAIKLPRNSKYIIIGIVLSFVYQSISARDVVPKYRLGIKVNGEISNKLAYTVELQERIKDRLLFHDSFYTEANLHYKTNELFRYSIGYRLAEKFSLEDGNQTSHRFMTDMRYANDILRWSYKVRSRFQISDPEFITSLNNDMEYHNRNEFEVAYNIYQSPITPVIAYEVYLNLHPSTGSFFEKNRYCVGADILVNQRFELNILYMFDQRINASVNSQIIELMCTVNL